MAKNKNLVAIVAMVFMFAMISFVTNMAAPFGTIWVGKYQWGGLLGNMMNFIAYLVMGIPAGNLLSRIGYKKTLLTAIAVGFCGVFIQLLSSKVGAGIETFTVQGGAVELNYVIYLVGAFVSGICVCLLNTVCNPMLTILGGNSTKGNQYGQIAGTFNSLTGTLTPLFVGVLIGTVTDKTAMSDVAPLLYIALGVFVAAFIIISFVKVPEPSLGKPKESYESSPWHFRHFVLGAISIFFYVGIEVGIPGQLIFFLSDATEKGAGILQNGAAIAGAIAAMYWLMMLVGRTVGAAVSAKIHPAKQLRFVVCVAIVLAVAAIFFPKTLTVSVPGYSGAEGFTMCQVPVSALLLVLCGLCTSVMWGAIFNLAIDGLGKYTEKASGIFMMMVCGGGIMPFIQSLVAKSTGYLPSYWVVVAMLAFLLFYAVAGCKNVNKDIKVD